MTKPMLKQCLHRHATFRDAMSNGRRSTFAGLHTESWTVAACGPVALLSRILVGKQNSPAPLLDARVRTVLGTAGTRDHGRSWRR